MHNGVILRLANVSDRDFIVRCNRAMARETEALELDESTLSAGVAAALNDSGRGFYLLAEGQGKALGSLLVTSEWSDWRNSTFWWIQSVYVVPEARGRGVYRALHGEVARRAQERGNVCGIRLYVDRSNRHARAVYEALGMSVSHYDLMEQAISMTRSAAGQTTS